MGSENQSILVKVPAIVSLVVVPVFIITRLWIRLAMTKFFGIDDWMILGSMVSPSHLSSCSVYLEGWLNTQISSILMSTMLLNGKSRWTIAAVNASSWPVQSHSLWIWNAWTWNHAKAKPGYGFEGKANIPWDLCKVWWTDRTQYYWYVQTFYKITLNVTKISILLLYLRVFIQKWLRIGCYLILALVITYGLISVFYSSVFQCTPVSKAYHKSIPGHCINVRKTWQANAGFNIASDFMILVLPMPAIYSLQMTIKHKLGLVFLFGLGSLWVYPANQVEEMSSYLCQCSCR